MHLVPDALLPRKRPHPRLSRFRSTLAHSRCLTLSEHSKSNGRSHDRDVQAGQLSPPRLHVQRLNCEGLRLWRHILQAVATVRLDRGIQPPAVHALPQHQAALQARVTRHLRRPPRPRVGAACSAGRREMATGLSQHPVHRRQGRRRPPFRDRAVMFKFPSDQPCRRSSTSSHKGDLQEKTTRSSEAGLAKRYCTKNCSGGSASALASWSTAEGGWCAEYRWWPCQSHANLVVYPAWLHASPGTPHLSPLPSQASAAHQGCGQRP